ERRPHRGGNDRLYADETRVRTVAIVELTVGQRRRHRLAPMMGDLCRMCVAEVLVSVDVQREAARRPRHHRVSRSRYGPLTRIQHEERHNGRGHAERAKHTSHWTAPFLQWNLQAKNYCRQ